MCVGVSVVGMSVLVIVVCIISVGVRVGIGSIVSVGDVDSDIV